mmetsp:Transcript_58587/g.171925  ORF Transcript_58587/g.171925 Transcript_58587/m.171925 type:complete len:217 (+) Transcript_58587:147-797(+)
MPKRRLDTVSWAQAPSSAMHTQRAVRQLPLRLCLMSRVSALSRQGTKASLPPFLKAEMQRPRELRERLMFLASCTPSPRTSVFLMRSLPARSTKRNRVWVFWPSLAILVIVSVTRQWERLDRSLSAWLRPLRLASITRITCSRLPSSCSTSTSAQPWTSTCWQAGFLFPFRIGGTHLPFASRAGPPSCWLLKLPPAFLFTLPRPAMGTLTLFLSRS